MCCESDIQQLKVFIPHVHYKLDCQVGGSILSSKLAMERGWAINVGGGFHHCSANEGGGFCVYADIALCIQFAFVRFNISRWVWFSSISPRKN